MPGPYEIYLVRHGLAEERGDSWPDDAKRPLTDEGISRMRKSVRGLSRHKLTDNPAWPPELAERAHAGGLPHERSVTAFEPEPSASSASPGANPGAEPRPAEQGASPLRAVPLVVKKG